MNNKRSNIHNFVVVILANSPLAGPCSKCGLMRNELLDNSGALKSCEVSDDNSGKELKFCYEYLYGWCIVV